MERNIQLQATLSASPLSLEQIGDRAAVRPATCRSMTSILREKEICRQFRGVLPLAEPHELSEIRAMLRNHQIRLALMVLQALLETALDGPFDSKTSQKLDAVKMLLDE